MNLQIESIINYSNKLELKEKALIYCKENLMEVFCEPRLKERLEGIKLEEIKIKFRRHLLVYLDEVLQEPYLMTQLELFFGDSDELFAHYKCVFDLSGEVEDDYFDLQEF